MRRFLLLSFFVSIAIHLSAQKESPQQYLQRLVENSDLHHSTKPYRLEALAIHRDPRSKESWDQARIKETRIAPEIYRLDLSWGNGHFDLVANGKELLLDKNSTEPPIWLVSAYRTLTEPVFQETLAGGNYRFSQRSQAPSIRCLDYDIHWPFDLVMTMCGGESENLRVLAPPSKERVNFSVPIAFNGHQYSSFIESVGEYGVDGRCKIVTLEPLPAETQISVPENAIPGYLLLSMQEIHSHFVPYEQSRGGSNTEEGYLDHLYEVVINASGELESLTLVPPDSSQGEKSGKQDQTIGTVEIMNRAKFTQFLYSDKPVKVHGRMRF